jgi:TolB-like protein/DNA-binding SARP family transcriptional activator/cytochrome c-type biogenesis protein CcmH/NrfG
MDKVSASEFRLALLGSFELTGPDGIVDLGSKKLAGLLAYLACTAPEPQGRERLKSLLWGSHFEEQSRQNLRKALSRLRRELGEKVLITDGERVSLAPGAVVCDAARFEALVRDGGHDALAEAIQLYKGPLLADTVIAEEAWVDWLTAQRQRLEGLAVDAMVRRGEQELQRGNSESALDAANRALAINDLREDAHRLVLRALAAAGRRSDALRHYEHVTALFKRELNVEPDASTKTLAAELRRSEPAAASPALAPDDPPLPTDRPSIAVLPFANLSGDPEQEYFADGMAEEVITALSHCHSLMVIARNSTFVYKGKPVDVRRVGRELGVRYVLEGSVRRGGSRLRFSGQLIDATTGNHIWADRFEGDTTDVFELQDRFSESVVANIEPRLQLAEIERLKHKPASNLNAYDLLLRAQQAIYEWTAESVEAAMRRLEQALALDPNYALACAMLANCYATRRFQGWAGDHRAESAEGLRYAARAVELGKDDGEVLWRSANATWHLAMDAARASELIYRALRINPNSSIALTIGGWIELPLGNPEKALELLQRAQRLSPRDPRGWTIAAGLAYAHYQLGKYAEAAALAEKALTENPRFAAALWFLAASLVRLGETQKAAAIVAQVLKMEPTLTISGLRARTMYTREDLWKPLAEDLRRAGMPE